MSLFIRNLISAILAPGVVTALVPWIIIRADWSDILQNLRFYNIIGLPIFVAGLSILPHCIWKFAVVGRGTLLPIDPTKHLVSSGLYKFSRNPMYLGVISMLIGESAFSMNKSLWLYTLFVVIVFNIFIRLIEEPRLINDFSDEYRQYCKNVRRWF